MVAFVGRAALGHVSVKRVAQTLTRIKADQKKKSRQSGSSVGTKYYDVIQ
jgi:hypothetical protein